MQALLASPSTRFDSPDSSFGSDSTPSSSGSLRLPALSSPFELNSPLGAGGVILGHKQNKDFQSSPLKHQKLVEEGDESFSDDDHEAGEEDLGLASPSSRESPLVTTSQPAWMTDELEEEWVQSRDSDESSSQMTDTDEELDDDEERSMSLVQSGEASPTSAAAFVTAHSFPSSSSQTSPERSIRSHHPFEDQTPVMPKYSSINQPKVPSSLRHAFTQSTATDAIEGDASSIELPSAPAMSAYGGAGSFNSNPTTASDAGSFVVRSEKSDHHAAPSQLQAAVRALRGPAAGLGAVASEDEGSPDQESTPLASKAVDRLGLMKLFEPPSPPIPAPPSTVQAPSSDKFTFTPPAIERTSYKSLVSPSPTRTASATPIARPQSRRKPVPSITPEGATPTSRADVVAPTAPGLKAKDRILRSEAVTGVSNLVSPPLVSTENEPEALSILNEEPPNLKVDGSPPRTQQNFSPFPLTPAPQPSTPPRQMSAAELPETPRSAVKLFEFQYDTYTRDHLAALVEEIDQSTSSAAGTHGRSMWVDVLPRTKAHHEDGEEDVEENSRTSKRIRLSPRWTFAEGVTPRRGRRLTSVGSVGRSARKVVSPQAAMMGETTKRRLDEANSLLDRIRAKADMKKRETVEIDEGHEEEDTTIMRQTPRQNRNSVAHEELGPDSPIPRLAAAASASIRHALSESAATTSSSSGTALSSFRASAGGNTASRSTLGHGRRPSLAQSIIAASNLSNSASSPSGRRHFATTPVALRSTTKRGQALGERFAPNSSIRILSNTTDESSGKSSTDEEKQSTRGSTASTTATTGTIVSDDGSQNSENSKKAHSRQSSLTTIGPQDISSALLASATSRGGKTSRMVFDQQRQRWIKMPRSSVNSIAPSTVQELAEGDASVSTEDDPFRDFDSTRASGDIRDELNRSNVKVATREMPPGLSGLGITATTPEVPLQIPANELVASPLDACYFEPPPVEERAEEVEAEEDAATWGSGAVARQKVEVVETLASSPPREQAIMANSAPATPRSLSPVMPRSVLKNGTARSNSAPNVLSTPQTSGDTETRIPRSVSFSDGKAEGKIEGLVAVVIDETQSRPSIGGSRLKFQMSTLSDGSTQASTEEVAVGEPGSLTMEVQDITAAMSPSARLNASQMPHQNTSVEVVKAGAGTNDSMIDLSNIPRCSTAQGDVSSNASNRSTSRTFRRTTSANATFLTECSFGISTDRVVQHITDIEPFEPDWEHLTSIDLNGKKIESIVRLNEFLPNLDEVNLNDNQLAFLTGAPSSLRTLLVASNRLSGLTSLQHLLNLERIDISGNQLISVSQFASLRHLRELKADDNLISDLEGLAELDGLQKLSVRGNKLTHVDLGKTKWPRLETLDLGHNKISFISGLERLQCLMSLNLDDNSLESVNALCAMPHLRVLRLSSNPISEIDVSFAPKLRTLFIDSAQLSELNGLDKLKTLENLSLRDQSNLPDQKPLSLSPTSLRDIKRLYLSSTLASLSSSLFYSTPSSDPQPFYNLIYLSLSHSRLTTLPSNLSTLIPNVRVLDLDQNPLTELNALIGLKRLKKLSVVGARLDKIRNLSDALGTFAELESLDLRSNPLTVSFYPSISSSTENNSFKEDQKHKNSLSDEWYFRRLSYRSIVLSLVKKLKWFDGQFVVEKEKNKLGIVVEQLGK